MKAVVGKRESKIYANIDGVRYTDGYDIYLAKKRDRRRHRQSGDQKKQRYRVNRVERISFSYEDGGEIHTTDPKTTICPISPSYIDVSSEYNIMVSDMYI